MAEASMLQEACNGFVDDLGQDHELPSCEGCRKRKLKCSRQRPTCSNCERYGSSCLYEQKRNKPGLKAGAIESLSRRLEALERVVSESRNGVEDSSNNPLSNSQLQQRNEQISQEEPSSIVNILSKLASEISKLNNNITTVNHAPQSAAAASIPTPDISSQFDVRPAKRRRLSEDICSNSGTNPQECGLPTEEVMNEVLDIFFRRLAPWLPVLHEIKFRRDIQHPDGRRRNHVILHAMIVATLKSTRLEAHDSSTAAEAIIQQSEDYVLRHAMSKLSVESLQALTIVAFIQIGNGVTNRAWPIIGSLTRIVQYLQLSEEENNRQDRTSFLASLPSIPKSSSWVEEEMRRRVFWNIFILDRFCSITTGSNTSLTATDVCRRLPVCGGLWLSETPAVTPYFGIWSDSTASLGNSTTFLATHYPSPAKTAIESSDHNLLGVPRHQSNLEAALDLSSIGAFAYYIESIESLSRVNTYFLQQRMDPRNTHQVLSWLTRFKELDLRLVHWKMFLPNQWKDSGCSRETSPGIMDPNMTAANATHNVAMILLHSKIAYPGPELSGLKLPSACSADTCYNAAVETANMTTKFLEQAKYDIVTPQLGFCAFVSARVLLVHWRYYHEPLSSELWTLIQNLEEMSRRWNDSRTDGHGAPIFSQFAAQLRALYQRCLAHPDFLVNVCDSSGDVQAEEHDGTPGSFERRVAGNGCVAGSTPTNTDIAQVADTSHLATNLITGLSSNGGQWASSEIRMGETNHMDDLASISETLMGQGFMDMDRIISFDDMMPPVTDVVPLPGSGTGHGF